MTKVTKVTLAIKGHLGRWTLLQKQRPLLQQLRQQQPQPQQPQPQPQQQQQLRALLRQLLLLLLLKVSQEPRDGLDLQDL